MTYYAWIRSFDGTETKWTGLRRTQALWRYHWLTRNWRELDAKEWGWRLEKGN
jgi:hypothetical protein